MRYIEITENLKRPINFDDFDIFWKTISLECSDICESYQDTRKLLYRGIFSTERALLIDSPVNRQPRDSNKAISAIFNDSLRKLGITALRSNSIFTTSDKKHTDEFGDPYVVFPLNGFKFSYTNQPDLTLDYWQNVINETIFKKLVMKYHQINKGLTNFNDLLLKSNINSVEDLLAFLKKLFSNDLDVLSLTTTDLVNPRELAKRYDISDNDIEYAIRNNFEVLIHGQAFLISEIYEPAILEKLKIK